jgi:hypothetical protein
MRNTIAHARALRQRVQAMRDVDDYDGDTAIEEITSAQVEEFLEQASLYGENYEICAVQADPRKIVERDIEHPQIYTPSYQERRVMFNGLPRDVITQDRSGLKVRHKAGAESVRLGLDVNPGQFVVRVYRTIGNMSADFDVQSMALDVNGTYDPNSGVEDEQHVLRNILGEQKEQRKKWGIGSSTIRPAWAMGENAWRVSGTCIEYIFTMEELATNHSIYCPELDLVISVDDQFSGVPMHPSNIGGMKKLFLQGDPTVHNSLGVQHRIFIVDNAGSVRERYTNINGEVYRLMPVKSKLLSDGAWLIRTDPVYNNRKGRSKMSFQYAPIRKMDEVFNLYMNYEDAYSLGGQLKVVEREEMQYKLQTIKLKREQADQDNEMTLIKNELEREKMTRQREQEEWERSRAIERFRWEREREAHERRMLVMKEKYERASHNRKSFLDILKSIPTVISGLGTLAACLLAFL